MSPDSRIFVAGHRGMVGSAMTRHLREQGFENLLTATSDQLDLRVQGDTADFLAENRPDVVVIAAAKVGGIKANDSFPAEFAYDNLMIEANLIKGGFDVGVQRLLFLGSSCIYPKFADQPIKESSLLSGHLEPTNEAYAVAKIAGLKMCDYFRKQYGVIYHSAMPCNLYGYGDNYHPENSHVIPGMIRRFHEAKESQAEFVEIWGSGTPRREFLFSDDVASACVKLLQLKDPPGLVNVGASEDVSIQELATLIARVVGFEGEIRNDRSKPDGTPRKLMDSTVMRSLGWNPSINLEEGLEMAYRDFVENCL